MPEMVSTAIKVGDIVTVELHSSDREAPPSNTFLVARKLENESVLQHPLAPGVYLIKPDSELNRAGANLKNSEERQLEYCSSFEQLLGYDAKSMLDSLKMYYVVNRKLSGRQRKVLSDLCGEVASVYCNYDVSIAIRLVNDNQPLLDSHNQTWYANLFKVFSGKKPASGLGVRNTIFNMAGFVLAQLQESRVTMRYNQET